MTLTRWIKPWGDTVTEAPASPRFRREWYPEQGYIEVPPELAHLPASRLGITNGAVVELPEPPGPDTTDFAAACAEFRATCAEIGTLIGAPDFRGGFDEMAAFRASGAATTAAGMVLALRWLAADKICTYEGVKLGYDQPAWWYKCWEIEEA